MKKLAVILIVVLCIVFVGCSNAEQAASDKTEVVAYAIDTIMTDGTTGNEIQVEQELSNWYSQKYGRTVQPHKSEITVEFEGKSYTAPYSSTDAVWIGTRTVHRYETVSSSGGCKITVDACTGKLIGVTVYRKYVDGKFDQKIFDACKENAAAIAEKYIDVTYFKMEHEIIDGVGYKFVYTQYVGDQKTNSFLSIRYDFAGNFEQFVNWVDDGYQNVGKSKKGNAVEAVQRLESNEAQQIALTKVKTILKDSETEKIEFSGSDLYVMPDGKLVKKHTITVKLKDDRETNGISFSQNTLFVHVALLEQE
ncbi:MAG: hypothetical protein IJA41_04010 [Clostridia bacterium]|nr:hypothetical protein [Clostridia bacterium]